MKALVKYEHGIGNLEIREMPAPEPGYGEVLIQVAYCGICGTDLKIYEDKFEFTKDIYPLEQWKEAFDMTGSGEALKVIIKP